MKSKNNNIVRFASAGITAIVSLSMIFAAACSSGDGGDETTESPIKSVTTIGYVDTDAAKIKAIAVEYDEELTADADISADTYSITIYDPKSYLYIGDGKVGDITDVYVNDEAAVSDVGAASGNYVIIELFTDYLYSDEQSFTITLQAKVTQVKDITLADGGVIKAGNTYTSNTVNNQMTADSFILPELDGWEFYTDDAGLYGKTGDAFVQENCFNQQDGLYYDEHLSYALYLPDNYEEAGGKNGNWAMVTLENPAATVGTHPLVSVLQTRSPSVYASDWAQELVRDQHGVDGLIVVVPVVTERVNDNGGTPAEYEALVHLWDTIIADYGVNPDFVYGSGQSVGGMVLVETQRNRDNFFAGILLYEDQWAQNYYMDTLFVRDMANNAKTAATATRHYPRTDDYITWNYYLDTDGNEVTADHDPYNMYYLVSDDNIMVLRVDSNNLSIDTWNEMNYLYTDTVGASINRLEVDATTELSEQNGVLKDFLNPQTENQLNINAVTLVGGASGYACRTLDYTYEWLLTQTRESEIKREKLDINKPFVLADEQNNSDERKLYFTDVDGNALYFLTAAQGSGTQFYNTSWLNLSHVADAAPGWLPDGMSWEKGVSGAQIVSVKQISSTAVAIEYSEDMENLYVNLYGDEIIGLDGNVREDIKVEVDPFAFFTADDTRITCTIKNVYVNSLPETREGAERGEGSGVYVIVEFEAALGETPAYIIQSTTLHTDWLIASALPWKYYFDA